MRSLRSVTLVLSLAAAHCGSVSPSPALADAGSKPDTGPKADAEPKGDAGHAGDAGPKSDGGCRPAAPTSDVPSPSSCSTSRPPSMAGDAGASDAGLDEMCTSDSQCTAGKNGRCLTFTGGDIAGSGCSYDECFTGADCGSDSICVCGVPTTDGQGRTGHTCLPSNCESNSDCGAGGSCSPTFNTTCGAFSGVTGYYCHKPANECTVDECVNDSDCTGEGEGWCAWDASSSKWACFYGACSG